MKTLRNIYRKLCIASMCTIFTIFMSGCSQQHINPETEYTVGGAILGGLAGSAFGGGSGRLIGATLGAGAGALLGSYLWEHSENNKHKQTSRTNSNSSSATKNNN